MVKVDEPEIHRNPSDTKSFAGAPGKLADCFSPLLPSLRSLPEPYEHSLGNGMGCLVLFAGTITSPLDRKLHAI